jgi:hypothetical protein
MSILNVDGDVVQDDDTYLFRMEDRLLQQGHTYTALMEEARHGISHITVNLANNTIRAFVVFVLLDNYQHHIFALVQKLGVWFLLDPTTQEVTEEDGSTTIDKCGLRSLPGIEPSVIMDYVLRYRVGHHVVGVFQVEAVVMTLEEPSGRGQAVNHSKEI